MKHLETGFQALGTVNTVSCDVQEERLEAARDRLRSIRETVCKADDLWSVFKPDSLINRINDRAGLGPVPVDERTFRLLERSLEAARLSGGAFDPTVGAQTAAWRRQRDKGESFQANAASWSTLELDAKQQTAFLRQAGVRLDLGGIAKGFLLSEATELMRQAGIGNAILNFGGSVSVLGGSAPVGIRDPFSPLNAGGGKSLARLWCRNELVITSGVYEQNPACGHHILDPRTGHSADRGLLSVTLCGTDGALLDALATACIVLGPEESAKLCQTKGIEAVFVLDNGQVLATNGLQGRLEFRKEAKRHEKE